MNREEERAYETRRAEHAPGIRRARREERASCMSALYRAGLRPSLRPVSGSTSLLEASQKGAFLTPGSVTPRVHQSGASRPTPPLSHSSEKQAGKIRVPIGPPLVSFRFRDGCCLRGGWLRAWRCGVDGVVVEMRLWRCWLFQNNDR